MPAASASVTHRTVLQDGVRESMGRLSAVLPFFLSNIIYKKGFKSQRSSVTNIHLLLKFFVYYVSV